MRACVRIYIGVTACVAALVLLSPRAHAAAPDGCQLPEYSAPVSSIAALGEALNRVLQFEPRCRTHPDWLFWVGQTLNTLHRYPEAAERLEAALMYQPDHWQARLEYLVALEGSNDIPAARALRTDLLNDPGIPASVRAQLAQRRLPDLPLWREQSKAVFGSLTLIQGYDDNLLGSPTLRSLDLTVGDSIIPVALADSSRPRAGAYTRLDYRHQYQQLDAQEERLWQLIVAASARQAPAHPLADYTAYDLRAENAAYRNGPYVQASLIGARNRSATFYRQTGIEAGWERNRAEHLCRLRAGVEAQRRTYPGERSLDGNYLGLILRQICLTPGTRIELRLGQDHARHPNRPGGDRQRAQLALGHAINWSTSRLYLDAEYEHLRDQEGYSPLLAHNLKRRINRRLYRIEYNKTLADIELMVGIEHGQHRANLPLFTSRTTQLYLAIRRYW